MIPAYRARFNAGFTEAGYRALIADISARTGAAMQFRVSETPCFFPRPLMEALSAAALEMIEALLGDPAYLAAADAVVPPRFRVSRSEARPTFIQVDFGLVRDGARVEGRLVELQAFPSLYGFQLALADAYRGVRPGSDRGQTGVRPGSDRGQTGVRPFDDSRWSDPGLTPFLGGLDRSAYLALMRRALLGPHDAANVVLMEIEPSAQKTLPDFVVTEQLWGVRAIDIRDVIVEGPRLFYRRDGALTRIQRIYNRVIPDELERKGLTLPFDYRDELDVEWLGAPDWYFRLSKFSIPHLRHPWVPITVFLHDALEANGVLGAAYADRDRWLLKPLFSFAGGGILFAPTDAHIAAIPTSERPNYILQQRVSFTPVIETPHGATQAEIRIMLVKDGDTYRPVLPLIRMGRGKMMGVDHNKGMSWVGSSAGFIG